MSSEGPGQSSRDRQEAIRNKIGAWSVQANWEDEDRADRLLEDVFENFDAFVDPQMSASDNWEKIKDELGLRTKTESVKQMRDLADAEDNQALDEIERIVQEYGPLAVFEAVYERDPDVDPELERIVDDLLEEVTPDTFDEFARTELQGRLDLTETGFEIRRREDIERLEDELREVRNSGTSADQRDEVLNELERSFGIRFDGLDDAINRLRERMGVEIDESRGVVRAESTNGDVDLSINVQAGSDLSDGEENQLLSRVRDEVALSAFGSDGPGVSIDDATVASFTIEDGVFTDFDTSQGRDAATRARGGITDDTEIAESVLNRFRAPNGVANLLNRFNDDVLETLTDQLQRGSVSGDVRMDLFNQLDRAERSMLRERAADRPGFADLLDELGVLVGGPVGELLDALESDPENLRDFITRGQMADILELIEDGEVEQAVVGDLRDEFAALNDSVVGTLVAEYSPSGDAFDSTLFQLLQEINAPVPRPDDIGAAEPDTAPPDDDPDLFVDDPGDVDMGAMIPDAETGKPSLPSDMVNVPEAELAVTPGRGKDASHFQQVIQELRGQRDPDKIPEEEIQRLKRSIGKKQELIQEAERQLTRLKGGGTGSGNGPSASAGEFSGSGGIPGPSDPTSSETFNEIEDMLPRTRFEVTQRPDPGDTETLRTRFPVPTKRMQYERLERQRLGTSPVADPTQFVQLVGEDSWPNPPLEVEEFLAGQQRRFIG